MGFLQGLVGHFLSIDQTVGGLAIRPRTERLAGRAPTGIIGDLGRISDGAPGPSLVSELTLAKLLLRPLLCRQGNARHEKTSVNWVAIILPWQLSVAVQQSDHHNPCYVGSALRGRAGTPKSFAGQQKETKSARTPASQGA